MMDSILSAYADKLYMTENSRLQRLTWKDFYIAVNSSPFVLFGSGVAAKDFLSKYGHKFRPLYIIDNDKRKWGTDFMGYSIKSPEALKENENPIPIMISSTVYYNEIASQLEELGVNEYFSFCTMECRMWETKRHFWKWVLFHPNGLFRNYIVFHIKALLRMLRIPAAVNPFRPLKKYKNRYKGKRCFIIGTGASLKLEDVNALRGEITFSMNGIFSLYGKTDWRPTFYVLLDVLIYGKYKDQAQQHLPLDDYSKEAVFVTDFIRDQLSDSPTAKKTVFVPVNYLNHCILTNNPSLGWYTENLLWGHYDATTVTNLAINLAHYMGIKEIYLLGIDCNYTSKLHYFDGTQNNMIQSVARANKIQNNMLASYASMKKILNARGVSIYNATRGGNLEVFPRVSMDTIIKEKLTILR